MDSVVYVGRFESRSFTFESYGRTEDEARRAMDATLAEHTEQYGLDADWFSPDDISVGPRTLGWGYRDGWPVSEID